MSRAARVYDFTLNANGAFVILAEGSFYRLMSATGAVEVRRNNGSIVGPLLPGQGERAEFISLTITDKSGAANAGTILIADDSFIDERISGEVSVIDGSVSRALAGRTFLGAAISNAVAGQFSHVQLWNPPASGVRAIVQRVIASGFAGVAVFVRMNTAALTALANNAPNKVLSGAVSVCQLRTENNVASLGGTNYVQEWRAGNTSLELKPGEPFIVDPGYGLLVINGNVNVTITGGFDFWEVST